MKLLSDSEYLLSLPPDVIIKLLKTQTSLDIGVVKSNGGQGDPVVPTVCHTTAETATERQWGKKTKSPSQLRPRCSVN